ncbi:MAG TPA: hypothetical protein VFI27_15155, partial [candidate division Zixibacteria bacterium]|nr:hypothetical protein [candidate division Zixibacteria bacterium]
MVKKQENHIALVVGLISAAVILYWGANQPARLAFDDAFITYRYADNLRQGLGLVYNPGEWVLGTTTPLYALLLAGLGLVVTDLQLLGHWLGVFMWVAASWGAMVLLRAEGWPRAGFIAGLLLAFQPLFLLTLGMETALVVALMLWVAWAWLGRRKRLAVILAAALILTRQDGALWIIFLGLEIWRREKRLPWHEAVAVSALVLPWFVYAIWRYGSILPNSALAKVGQNEFMPVGGLQSFSRELWRMATSGLNAPLTMLYAAVLFFGVGVVAGRARQLCWLMGWLIMYVISYHWLGVVSFPWYFLPALTVATLVIAVGGGYLLADSRIGEAETADRSWLSSSPWFSLVRQVVGLSALFLLIGAQVNSFKTILDRRDQPVTYVSVAQWLADNTSPEASVATIEIGLIGYHSQRPIVDTMGLVSSDMTEHQVGWVETLVYALNTYRPDYALTLTGTAWDTVVNQWWFQGNYQEVAHFGNATIYEMQEPDGDIVWAEATADFVGGLRLTGASFSSQELKPGQDLAVWLDLTVQLAQPPDLAIEAYLVDVETYERVTWTKTAPFDGLYQSDRWQPGDNLRIPVRLPIPAEMEPGALRLGVSIFDPSRNGGLPLTFAPEVLNSDVQVGWLWLGKSEPPQQEDLVAEKQAYNQWVNGIELINLALPDRPLTPGEALPVQLMWRTTLDIKRDLTVFMHLVDNQGQIVAQHDQRPANGRWSTQVWQPGEVYYDLHRLDL